MYDPLLTLQAAQGALGAPYKLGAKWDPKDSMAHVLGPNRPPIDCSGFVRWALAQGGYNFPDGSEIEREDTDYRTW